MCEDEMMMIMMHVSEGERESSRTPSSYTLTVYPGSPLTRSFFCDD